MNQRTTDDTPQFKTCPDELAALEGQGHKRSPEEIGTLAKRLAKATDSTEAARLRERLTRGFYGS